MEQKLLQVAVAQCLSFLEDTADCYGRQDTVKIPQDFDDVNIHIAKEVLSAYDKGGMIQDCGGEWCSHGDNVRFYATSASEERTGELVFDTDLFKWQVDGMDLGDVYEWYRI